MSFLSISHIINKYNSFNLKKKNLDIFRYEEPPAEFDYDNDQQPNNNKHRKHYDKALYTDSSNINYHTTTTSSMSRRRQNRRQDFGNTFLSPNGFGFESGNFGSFSGGRPEVTTKHIPAAILKEHTYTDKYK